MTPAEIEMRAALHRLAEYARTERLEGPEPLVGEERRRPLHAWTAAAAAAVLVVTALTGAFLAAGNRRGQVAADGPLAPGVTGLLADAGLAGRTGASSVWTGTELLVWGGLTFDNRYLSDGAALDPATNRWRPLPPAPIGPRSDAPAVWTGKEMLVWGGLADSGAVLLDGAAFDPRTNRWRIIASQPFGGASRSGVVWTGSEMVIVSALNGLNTTAYDPATDRWRRLADPPGAPLSPYPEAVWTGSELVLLLWPSGPGGYRMGSSGPGPAPTAVAHPETTAPPGTSPPPPPLLPPLASGPMGPNSAIFAGAYSPATGQWTTLPAVDLIDGTVPRIAWTGSEVLVLQGSRPGAAYDSRRRAWRPLAPFPGERLPDAEAVWTGRQALVWAGGDVGWGYDLAADAWVSFDAGGLRPRSNAVVAWADGLLVAWSGFYDGSVRGNRMAEDGVRYRPPG